MHDERFYNDNPKRKENDMSIILKPLKWCVGIMAKLVLNPLTRALLILGMVASVVLAVGSCIGGAYLMAGVYKYFAIPCIALGCFFSGFLLQSFLSNYIFRSTAERKSDQDKKISELNDTNKEQKEKIAELEKCKRDLSRQRIDINSFQPIMELALTEFDMTTTDVRIKWLKDEIALNQMLHDDKCPQYIGILDKKFKVKFGLDMKSVKIRRDSSGKKLIVSGLKPTFIGFKDAEENWLLREIQTFRLKKKEMPVSPKDLVDTEDKLFKDGFLYEKDRCKEVETTLDLNRIEGEAEAQQKDLQDRINNGFDAVKFAEDYIVSMGEAFIRCLLLSAVPQKYEIEFDPDASASDAKPLLDFVNALDLEETETKA